MFWFLVKLGVMFLASWAIYEWMRPKPSQPEPAGKEDFDLPTAEEGRPYPAVWGMVNIKGPNAISGIINYRVGHKESNGQIQCFYYFFGLHYGLSHGSVDGLKQYWCGGKVFFPTVNDPTTLAADGLTSHYMANGASTAWGGWRREGGHYGQIRMLDGDAAQTTPAYLTTHLGAPLPAYRGIFSVLFEDCYWGTTGYLKRPRFIVKRTDIQHDGSAQWYDGKACVNTYYLNPAHIIREKLVSAVVGLGKDTSLIDSTTFEATADTLYEEGFGLAILEDSPKENIESFVSQIERLINGSLYRDRTTGKFRLELARDDYDAGSLTTYDHSDILEVLEFGRPSFGRIPSLTVVKWRDVVYDQVRMAADDDLAVLEKQGGTHVIQELDMPAVPTAALAAAIASREQKHASSMLASIRFKAKRTMADLHRNSVIKIQIDDLGITSMIVRIVSIDYGSLADGTLTIEAVEDVFGSAETVYGTPPDTLASDPNNAAADVTAWLLTETPYYVLANEILGLTATDALAADAALLLAAAAPPTNDHSDYDLLLRHAAGQDFVEVGTAGFAPTGTLTTALLQSAADVTITLTTAYGLESLVAGQLAQIDHELFAVVSVDETTSQVTLSRGMLDTVPAHHAVGARFFGIGAAREIPTHEYTATDAPAVKFLGRTGIGELDEGSATARTADAFDSRIDRPYNVGNLKIEGQAYPLSIPETGDIDLTWNHRDRTDTVQLQSLVKQDTATDYGPEATTTYTIEVYDETNTLVRTVTGETGTSWTYTNAMERSDCGLADDDPLNNSLRFVMWAVRGSYTSWQKHDITVTRSVLDPAWWNDELLLLLGGAQRP